MFILVFEIYMFVVTGIFVYRTIETKLMRVFTTSGYWTFQKVLCCSDLLFLCALFVINSVFFQIRVLIRRPTLYFDVNVANETPMWIFVAISSLTEGTGHMFVSGPIIGYSHVSVWNNLHRGAYKDWKLINTDNAMVRIKMRKMVCYYN